MKVRTERIRCSEAFLTTIPETYDATNGYDFWHVHEYGKLAEKWVVREKGKNSFLVEITEYVDDENL